MTKEFMEKAKQAKSAEELLALAKENGIEMDEAQANEMLEKLAELTDEELDEVAGGRRNLFPLRLYRIFCPECHWSKEEMRTTTPSGYTCERCREAGKIVECKVSKE